MLRFQTGGVYHIIQQNVCQKVSTISGNDLKADLSSFSGILLGDFSVTELHASCTPNRIKQSLRIIGTELIKLKSLYINPALNCITQLLGREIFTFVCFVGPDRIQ